MGPELDWRLAVALALLLALTALVAGRTGLPVTRPALVAGCRAALQLGGVALIVAAALRHHWSAFAFVAVMVTAATVTAAGRFQVGHRWPWVLLALLSGQVPVLTVIFGSGSTPFTPPAIVAIGGIVVGGTMTACTLTGRRALAELDAGRGLVEAGLALGLRRAEAIRLVVDPTAPESLVPVLDQTRTVGLVTLPGAFIGVLLGGGSPVEAATAQLVVLIGLVAAETITVAATVRFVASGRLLSDEITARLPTA